MFLFVFGIRKIGKHLIIVWIITVLYPVLQDKDTIGNSVFT